MIDPTDSSFLTQFHLNRHTWVPVFCLLVLAAKPVRCFGNQHLQAIVYLVALRSLRISFIFPSSFNRFSMFFHPFFGDVGMLAPNFPILFWGDRWLGDFDQHHGAEGEGGAHLPAAVRLWWPSSRGKWRLRPNVSGKCGWTWGCPQNLTADDCSRFQVQSGFVWKPGYS